jgi:hypothetical protein
MTPKPRYKYGQTLYVNDAFFFNVKVKCWGLAYMADPDYPKNQMCVYMCAVRLDGQNITLNVSERSLSPKPLRRANEVGTAGDGQPI